MNEQPKCATLVSPFNDLFQKKSYLKDNYVFKTTNQDIKKLKALISQETSESKENIINYI